MVCRERIIVCSGIPKKHIKSVNGTGRKKSSLS